MYVEFYGLREKPFALSPDPRYLFLAEAHREALAHLLYGIEQGEGFIAVTGEVGTGKTTLCRTLLQRLGAETEVAFIFNPDLTPGELLEAVASEFGIATEGRSRRDLAGLINEFLLHATRQGRRVLLIIDEAQNLAADTLEQVRLLSNLETETAKLIQIVLLGQPELEVKLNSQQLRQLRQRITVWWKLIPLTAAETREYVRHRLRVAGGVERGVFTDGALREVHRRAAGIPRVVNILCDRALLTAYADGAREVTRRHVVKAAGEVGAERRPAGPGPLAALLRPAVLGSVGVLALGLGLWQLAESGSLGRLAALAPGADDARTATAPAPAGAEPVGAPEALPAVSAPPPAMAPLPPAAAGEAAPAGSAPEEAPTLDDLLAALPGSISAGLATQAVLESWGLAPGGVRAGSLPEALQVLSERGLRVQTLTAVDLGTLASLNHPALVRLRGPDGTLRSLVLRRLDAREATILGLAEGAEVRVPAADLEARWTGEAYVTWREFEPLPAIIRTGHAGTGVYWLQKTLAELGYYGSRPTGRYDAGTISAVRAFQESRGLAADGEVGPNTKMALYDAAGAYELPRLHASAEGTAGGAG